MADSSIEPLLRPDISRYTMFPIRDQEIWNMYKKAIDSFWTPQEIDVSRDRADWENLSQNEKDFIKMVLAFFAGSDGIVNENLGCRFMNEVQLCEAKAFYGFQIAIENIHSEVYSVLLDTYIKDDAEKMHLFRAMETIPCIKKKADWGRKWISDTRSSFATRLFCFAIIEGVFFSGAFAAIFWLKKRGILPGLTFSNELISKDESLHVEFAVLLYNKLQKRLSKKRAYEIITEAVNIEKEFILESLPCKLIGMNSEMMSDYIEFVADRLLLQMGYSKLYNKANPFNFMEMISIQSKTNFFEKRVSEYALATKTKASDIFEFSADF
jgi:ribonucleotide reductase beta subunit family protein with ferritin-like domain